MTSILKITSEIYSEIDYIEKSPNDDGTTISRFTFIYPNDDDNDQQKLNGINTDADGDILVKRKKRGAILIEHRTSTELKLVGLQVWRGALILADFLFDNYKEFCNKNIIELGAGVGLTSITAAIYSKCNVICTDINIGGIMPLIQRNIQRNFDILSKNAKLESMELNFMNRKWNNDLENVILNADIILAADVIYDDDITDAFVQTLAQILDPNTYNKCRNKIVYIALEKRYVFTIADLETIAPCYEYFLRQIQPICQNNHWKMEWMSTDFPQYFDYERLKDLILIKINL